MAPDRTDMRQEHARRFGASLSNQAGLTLLEVMVVVALIGTMAAMAIMVSPTFLKSARADGGISQVEDTLRLARDTAISQRRNVRVEFVGLTAIRTVRENIGANGVVTDTTTIRTMELENHMQFRVVPDVPNTPGRVLALRGDSRRGGRVRGVSIADVHERRHLREPARATS